MLEPDAWGEKLEVGWHNVAFVWLRFSAGRKFSIGESTGRGSLYILLDERERYCPRITGLGFEASHRRSSAGRSEIVRGARVFDRNGRVSAEYPRSFDLVVGGKFADLGWFSNRGVNPAAILRGQGFGETRRASPNTAGRPRNGGRYHAHAARC